MNAQGYQCNLHHKSFQFFCERCLQLVCKQCTVIGPHHTQIHSLAKISLAYQTRITQIKQRIDNLVHQNRQKIFKIIIKLNQNIESIEIIRKSIDAENNKQKQRMLLTLMKQFQNNRNILYSYRQNLFQKINQINDLGFKYQNLKDQFQLLGSHNKIMQELKELHDRTQIFIDKDVAVNNFTKELTDIRLKIKQIQTLNELYDQKVKVLAKMLERTKKLTQQITSQDVDFISLLKDLNHNLAEINHNVCHFCGVVFTFEYANKQCPKNKVNFSQFFTNATLGSCKVPPDASKLGTQRHYFSAPKSIFQYYNSSAQNSFKVQMQGLLLKVKTLIKLHKVDIQKQFENNDKKQTGYCQKIVFDYIFIEILGLSQRQAQILLTITQKIEKTSLLRYDKIIQKLSTINI